MAIDLTGLSAQELAALIAQAEKRKHTLSKRKPIAAVRKALTAQAAAAGYSIVELFGGGAPKARGAAAATAATAVRKTTKGRKLGKVAPKYRNPANPKETWAGRGAQPRWMADLIKKGRKLEDFVIGQ